MPVFEYRAIDQAGRLQSGRLDAADAEEARQQLIRRGLTPERVAAVESTGAGSVADEPAGDAPAELVGAGSGSGGRLSDFEAEVVVGQVADISTSQVPLEQGLRAAAAEAASRRIARALLDMAAKIEQGADLQTVLNEHSGRFPAHVAGLIAAASRTSELGMALEELVDHHRQMRETWWRVAAALSYPLLVLALTFAVHSFLVLDVIPVFGQMFREFELELPKLTIALVNISHAYCALFTGARKRLTLGTVTALAAALVLVRMLAGPARWRRFLETVPLFGPILSWVGAAAFARMLAVLIDHQLPLPRALQLTADAMRDGNVRETCLALSAGVADGKRLSDLLESDGRLPATLVPFVRCGEQNGELADGLRAAGDVFLGRIQLRAALLKTISPPVIFVFIGLSVALSVIGLMLPLVSLIVGLS